jgi:hypothetical protein
VAKAYGTSRMRRAWYKSDEEGKVQSDEEGKVQSDGEGKVRRVPGPEGGKFWPKSACQGIGMERILKSNGRNNVRGYDAEEGFARSGRQCIRFSSGYQSATLYRKALVMHEVFSRNGDTGNQGAALGIYVRVTWCEPVGVRASGFAAVCSRMHTSWVHRALVGSNSVECRYQIRSVATSSVEWRVHTCTEHKAQNTNTLRQSLVPSLGIHTNAAFLLKVGGPYDPILFPSSNLYSQ